MTETTITRMRKAFRYPGDDEDNAPVEGMDEEEQEKTITSLLAANAEQNTFYKRIFLPLPLLAILHLVLTTLSSSTQTSLLVTILRLLCLLLSLLTLYDIPTGKSPTPTDRNNTLHRVRANAHWINVALCGLLMLGAWVRGGEGWWWSESVHLVVMGVVGVVRRELGGVDVGRLEGMRYRFKGA